MAISAIVHAPTNEFITDGSVTADGATYILVSPLPRNPDPAVERYSGNINSPFAAKTAGDIAQAKINAIAKAVDAAIRNDPNLAIGLPALLNHLPEMVQEIVATGKLNTSLHIQRIVATAVNYSQSRKET